MKRNSESLVLRRKCIGTFRVAETTVISQDGILPATQLAGREAFAEDQGKQHQVAGGLN